MLKYSDSNFQTLQHVYSSYSWIRGNYRSIPTDAELADIERQRNKFLGKVSNVSQTFFREATEYFPHVTTLSLQQGFYKKFSKLQGAGGVYYATTLLTFEILDRALEMTEALVQKYFP